MRGDLGRCKQNGTTKDGPTERRNGGTTGQQNDRTADGKNAGMREEAEIPGGFPLLFLANRVYY